MRIVVVSLNATAVMFAMSMVDLVASKMCIVTMQLSAAAVMFIMLMVESVVSTMRIVMMQLGASAVMFITLMVERIVSTMCILLVSMAFHEREVHHVADVCCAYQWCALRSWKQLSVTKMGELYFRTTR